MSIKAIQHINNKFPKNIFQVWFQGCENIQRQEFVANKNNWKAMNPTWNYHCVSDKEMIEACKLFSDRCYQIYQSLPIMHMKIDLARYVLIYIYGGMYIDMDAYILRNLEYNETINEIIKKYETENINVLGLSKIKLHSLEKTVSRINYNNAFMISSAGNPLLKRFINHVLDQCEKYKFNHSNTNHNMVSHNVVQFTTGPFSFNQFFRDSKSNPESIIYTFDPEIFEPCDLNHNCQVTKNTIAIHQFEMSWLSPFMRYLGKLYFYIRNQWLMLVVLLMVIYYYKYTKRYAK